MKPQQLFAYHFIIFAVYLAAMPFVWGNFQEQFVYEFSLEKVAMGLVFFAISVLLFIFINKVIYNFGQVGWRRVPGKIVVAIALYAVLVAALEEIIFRAVIQNYLNFVLGSVWLALLLSTTIFAAVHLPNVARGSRPREWNWEFFFLAFLGGILLGGAYIISGELLVPTIMHALFLLSLRTFRTPHVRA